MCDYSLHSVRTRPAKVGEKLVTLAGPESMPQKPAGTRPRMSADVGDALLGFRLGSGLGPRGKREDSCILPLTEPRQQHDLAIGELERVMIDVKRALVDLAKDRSTQEGRNHPPAVG
jgi:hypothetical protein